MGLGLGSMGIWRFMERQDSQKDRSLLNAPPDYGYRLFCFVIAKNEENRGVRSRYKYLCLRAVWAGVGSNTDCFPPPLAVAVERCLETVAVVWLLRCLLLLLAKRPTGPQPKHPYQASITQEAEPGGSGHAQSSVLGLRAQQHYPPNCIILVMSSCLFLWLVWVQSFMLVSVSSSISEHCPFGSAKTCGNDLLRVSRA